MTPLMFEIISKLLRPKVSISNFIPFQRWGNPKWYILIFLFYENYLPLVTFIPLGQTTWLFYLTTVHIFEESQLNQKRIAKIQGKDEKKFKNFQDSLR